MTESVAFQIIQDLWRRNRIFCSSDYEECLRYLNALLPLNILSFPEEEVFNGWMIPPKWDLVEGKILFQGKEIFKVEHPLQIIGLSLPFKGVVSRDELRRHLHYDRRDPTSTPYHFRQHYRPWEREWGFCVPQQFYEQLQDGEYEVSIATQESPGVLQVAEHIKHGEHPETFAFVAHLDHPGMANDDLAGVAVGIEFMRRLNQQKTKFTYRLVLVQEMIGSVYYFGKGPAQNRAVLESCFLEMLGTHTQLAFQASREGNSQLERAIHSTLQKYPHREGPFRSIICNDEVVWESYGIPMASLSRYPYPEYHSDKDNPSIIHPDALEEAVTILLEAVHKLDKSTLIRKKFEGVLALSNPTYNLYVDPGQPAFGTTAPAHIQKLRLLMDLMPMFPKQIFVEEIARQVDLPIPDILSYLRQWQAKDLLEII